jgi:glycosyltransferase involved in cell wall biosynthesis
MIRWLHVQKYTRSFRIPIVIWLRSKGLLERFQRISMLHRIHTSKRLYANSPSNHSAHVLVICANFNHAKWLRQCVDSVRSQSFQNWTLVIVDDQSTDESLSVIREAKQGADNIFAIQLAKNHGAYVARNTAIQPFLSDSFWTHITFIDPDDVANPGWLEHVVRILGETEEGWVRPLLARVSEDLTKEITRYHGYCQSLIARKSWMKIGGFENVRVSGDADVIERLRRLAKLDELKTAERFAFNMCQQARLHSSNASRTRLNERKVWLENQMQSYHRCTSPEELRVSPKTAMWEWID